MGSSSHYINNHFLPNMRALFLPQTVLVPCRQSVRARASMRTGKAPAKVSAGISQLATTKRFNPLPPIASNPKSQSPPPRQDCLSSPEVPKRPELQSLPKMQSSPRKQKPIPPARERSVSPEFSDSDPEENYLNFSQFPIDQRSKKRGCSGSESSVSSSIGDDGSITPTIKKPPVATPRTKTPRSNTMRSNSETSLHTTTKQQRRDTSPCPPLPPRPSEDQEALSRPPLPPRPANMVRLTKHSSLEEDEKEMEPARPKNRPRKSEIKRARARAGKPRTPRANNAPSLTVVDEDGFDSMSVISSKSSKSNISSKSAPAYGMDKESKQKKRAKTAGNDLEANFLTPDLQPERPRRRSTDDSGYRESKKQSGAQVGEEELGELNPQVAGKLLKMIFSSEDPGLKAALREFISQDSSVAGSI